MISRAGSRATDEAGLLEREADRARAAIGLAFRRLKANLKAALDPRSWVKQYPKASAGIAAAAGTAAGLAAAARLGRRGAGPTRTQAPSRPRAGRRWLPARSAVSGTRPSQGRLVEALAAAAVNLLGALVARRRRVASPAARWAAEDRCEPPPAIHRRGARGDEIAPGRRGPPGVAPNARGEEDALPGGFWSILKTTVREWLKDDSFQHAAALAYYTIFSLAPLLIVVIAVAGFAFGKDAVRAEILAQMEALLGAEGAATVGGMLDAAGKPAKGIVAVTVGLVALLFGASGAFSQLKNALNKIWEVRQKPGSGWLRLFKERFLSFAMVVAVGFLLMVSLVVSAALTAAVSFLDEVLPVPPIVLGALDLLVSLGLITVLFALIYKVLPDVKLEWKDVWIGGAVTAALFTAGKFLVGLYLGRATVVSAYGAAGSVVVILLWTYYTALIFLLGAEFTQVQSRHARKIPEVKPCAERVPPQALQTLQEPWRARAGAAAGNK